MFTSHQLPLVVERYILLLIKVLNGKLTIFKVIFFSLHIQNGTEVLFMSILAVTDCVILFLTMLHFVVPWE